MSFLLFGKPVANVLNFNWAECNFFLPLVQHIGPGPKLKYYSRAKGLYCGLTIRSEGTGPVRSERTLL